MKTSTSEIFANSLFTNQTDGVDSSSNVQTAGAKCCHQLLRECSYTFKNNLTYDRRDLIYVAICQHGKKILMAKSELVISNSEVGTRYTGNIFGRLTVKN